MNVSLISLEKKKKLTKWSIYVVYRCHQVQVGQSRQLPQCTLGLLSSEHQPINIMY